MIQTEDLSKRFGDYWAVDGVSLDVYPEQVLALLGQNGSSKTTTVCMLTSVLAPTRGRARVAGFDVVLSPQQVRASVGVLTEQHGLYLRMTGLEYLDFFGKVYRLDAAARQKRNREWMEYFGLAEVAKRPIGQYSKGMRRFQSWNVKNSISFLHRCSILSQPSVCGLSFWNPSRCWPIPAIPSPAPRCYAWLTERMCLSMRLPVYFRDIRLRHRRELKPRRPRSARYILSIIQRGSLPRATCSPRPGRSLKIR